MKSSVGCGTLVGSGHQSNQMMSAPAITIGTDTMRSQVMLRRAKPLMPSPLANTKPSTKTTCHAIGLKNHSPCTGQLGSVIWKLSAAT